MMKVFPGKGACLKYTDECKVWLPRNMSGSGLEWLSSEKRGEKLKSLSVKGLICGLEEF